MRRLVIDTATSACSVALFDGAHCIAHFHEVLGRGHAERLVPMISNLPDKGRADSIHVDVGPGSFTGIRVGLSAAKALALAWGAQCHGYSSLQLIAAMARNGAMVPIDVAITGGHGEYYFQQFNGRGERLSEALSLTPAAAAAQSSANIIAGDKAGQLVALRGAGQPFDLLPDAQAWMAMMAAPPLSPSPLYVRGADAKLPGGLAP